MDDKIKEVMGLVDDYLDSKIKHGSYTYNEKTHYARALVESKLREMEAALEVENTRREAENLAWCLFNKHYAGDEDYSSGRVKFGLCDSLRGVLSQIDNMTVGLVRPHEQVIPPGYALVPVEPTEAQLKAAVKSVEGDAVYKSLEGGWLAEEEAKYEDVYTAMLSAAPTPSTSADALKGL